ncbi:FAS1-like dehydratase domain-containing protein [Streptomyces sp. NPDC002577]
MTDLIGTVVDRVAFGVERGKIHEFTRATFAEDPAHTDRNLAVRSGFPDVLATGTHVVVSGHHRDQRGFVEQLGLELSRVVVGSVNWRYRRPLVAGDELRGTRRVVADETREGRRGGTMRLITLETEYVDQHGEVAISQREVLIERGKA